MDRPVGAADAAAEQTAVVTIGIPTYNRLESLRRALASALAQDYPNLDVVISDNASTDGTEGFCREAQAKDARVRYVRHSRNRGAAENFRFALEAAGGDYFMWLADDDWLDTNYLSQCMNLHRLHPDTALASGRGVFHMPDGEQKVGLLMHAHSASACLRVLKYLMLVRDNSGFFGVGRRDVMRRIGTRNALGGDWVYVMCLAYLGTLRMSDATWVHRSPGGLGNDVARMVRAFDLPGFTRYFPFSVVAYNVARELLTNRALAVQRTLCTRAGLACLAAAVVLVFQGGVWRLVPLSYRLLSRVVGHSRSVRLKALLRRLAGL